MKKILCCLLAFLTVCVCGGTAVACGGSDKGSGTSAETPIDLSKVTLKLTKRTYDIENGQNVALEFQFTVDGEEGNISALDFSSSDEGIATVDENGTVTGVSGGKAYITIACGTKTTKATINVTMRENRLEISDESLMILVDGEKQVTATAYFGLTELTDAALSWQSSAPEVAMVENGLIKGVGSGKAEITVSYENVSKTVGVTVVTQVTAAEVNSFSEEYINIFGRTEVLYDNLALDHAANGVEVGFVGTSLTMELYSNAKSYMRVFIDGASAGTRIAVSPGSATYEIAEDLDEGLHTVRIVKATEESSAFWEVKSFAADKFFAVPEKSDLRIEFIGDSITAGYGVLGYAGQDYSVDNSDATKAYAYLTAQELNADYSVVAYSGICTEAYHWVKTFNMTTLYNRISARNTSAYAFDFDADIVVLNLGTNETSYLGTSEGGDYGDQFPIDYEEFLEKIRAKNPNAYIICLYGMGDRSPVIHNGIQTAIESFGDEKVVYNPFTFTGNGDGANGHPNAAAQKGWAEQLTEYIRTLGF